MGPTVKLPRQTVTRGMDQRGVRSDAANGYVFDAVPAMTMYRSNMCASEWSDRDLEEMVDQLPLLLLWPHGA